MREVGWALFAAALYFYAFIMTMQGKASGAIGVVFFGVIAARHGIKNRVFKLSFLICGTLLFAFTYFRFTDSVWAAGIVGLIMLGGIFFNDYRSKGK